MLTKYLTILSSREQMYVTLKRIKFIYATLRF